MELMSLKVDFAFKEIMQNPKVRQGFISAILQIPLEDIISTVILNSSLRKEHSEDKLGILDVRVELNRNIQIDIEIQVIPFKYWPERTLFYNSKMYVETIEVGNKYSVLKKVVSISILNFDLLQEKYFYNSFHIRNDKTHNIFTDKMEWHVIELSKLPKDIQTTDDLLLLWSEFIHNSDKEEIVEMIATKNECINEAYNELQKISANKQKRMEYESRQKAIYDYNTLMEDAEEKGIEKGIEQGIEKGIEQGIEKGRYETSINLAKKLLSKGFTLEEISEYTELKIEEIKKSM